MGSRAGAQIVACSVRAIHEWASRYGAYYKIRVSAVEWRSDDRAVGRKDFNDVPRVRHFTPTPLH